MAGKPSANQNADRTANESLQNFQRAKFIHLNYCMGNLSTYIIQVFCVIVQIRDGNTFVNKLLLTVAV